MARILYSPAGDCVLFDTRDLTAEQLADEFGPDVDFVEVGTVDITYPSFPTDQILVPE